MDNMFGSLSKRVEKLNLTPGKAHSVGSELGILACTPRQPGPGHSLIGALAEASSRLAGGEREWYGGVARGP